MLPRHAILLPAVSSARARVLRAATRVTSLSLVLALSACDRSPSGRQSGGHSPEKGGQAKQRAAYELPHADQRLCSAVALLIDTSGSMGQAVPDRAGAKQPKFVIARSALERIVAYTQQWRQEHPDRTLQLGIYRFSSSAEELLPMAEFDAEEAAAAAARLPAPGGGTAIGRALEAGFKALYATGCVRKYIVCVTDGNNTTGPTPERVARALHAQTGGEVEMHFVAFDTAADGFAFLKQVNGDVVEAADGAQLDARLAAIYEQRILAEALTVEKE